MSSTNFNALVPGDDAQALDALSRIDTALGTRGEEGLTAAAGENLCETYQKIAPWLRTIIPWVRRIPVFGARIAAALEFLMTIADAYCAR